MRLLRAGFAIWAFAEVWRTGDWMLFALGSILALQAIFNIGCCGAAGCATPNSFASTDRSSVNGTEEVIFEEVK